MRRVELATRRARTLNSKFGGSAALSAGRRCVLIDNHLQYCADAVMRLPVELPALDEAGVTVDLDAESESGYDNAELDPDDLEPAAIL